MKDKIWSEMACRAWFNMASQWQNNVFNSFFTAFFLELLHLADVTLYFPLASQLLSPETDHIFLKAQPLLCFCCSRSCDNGMGLLWVRHIYSPGTSRNVLLRLFWVYMMLWVTYGTCCSGLKSTLGREVEGSRKKEIVFILKLQYISLSLSLTDITALLGP